MRSKQLSFLPKPKLEFGGYLLQNKRKSERVLAIKQPIHLVLKGEIKKSRSLKRYEKQLNSEIRRWALRFNIKLYNFSINSNHIHLNIRISSRENYNKFIKTVAGKIVMLTKIKFILRPYTKILSWGREFRNFINYTIQNFEEANGLRPYKKRRTFCPSIKTRSYLAISQIKST